MNYGSLLLQALLENWWRPVGVDDEGDPQASSDATPNQGNGGNEFFIVAPHTPVIFRLAIFFCMYMYFCKKKNSNVFILFDWHPASGVANMSEQN